MKGNMWTFELLLPILCMTSNVGVTKAAKNTKRKLLRGPEPRIIGGTAVAEDNYPFLGGVFDRRSNGKVEHLCGASLIAPDIVISAAHCASDPTPDEIHVGRHDLEDDESYEALEIIDIVKHPDHVYDTDEHDLVLFKVSPSTHSYIELNHDPDIPKEGDSMTVMGWGEDKRGKYPDVPHETLVDFVPTDKCKKVYKEELFEDHMLCAVGEYGQDNCSGDSGGPLIFKGNNTNDFSLVGVVSWGWECGDRKTPSVYIDVRAEIDWIKNTLCALTDDQTIKRKICGKPVIVETSSAAAVATNSTTSSPVNVSPLTEMSEDIVLHAGTTDSTIETPTATQSAALDAVISTTIAAGTSNTSSTIPLNHCNTQKHLTETTWLATLLDSEALLFDSEMTAYFKGDGTMSISSICNKYATPYEIISDESYVKVGGFTTKTDRKCEEKVTEQEYSYLHAIARARAYRIECYKLHLLGENESVLLSFVADEV